MRHQRDYLAPPMRLQDIDKCFVSFWKPHNEPACSKSTPCHKKKAEPFGPAFFATLGFPGRKSGYFAACNAAIVADARSLIGLEDAFIAPKNTSATLLNSAK